MQNKTVDFQQYTMYLENKQNYMFSENAQSEMKRFLKKRRVHFLLKLGIHKNPLI